ncbi:MAG: Calx-beta domain-containing protein [Xenococcaceae cyanobacterium]
MIVAEGRLARFSVIRKQDISLPERVRVSSQNGSAKAGVDFDRLDRLLLFIPGQRQCDIEIAVFEDNSLDFDRDFTVHLSSTSEIGEPSIMNVEIVDVCFG